MLHRSVTPLAWLLVLPLIPLRAQSLPFGAATLTLGMSEAEVREALPAPLMLQRVSGAHGALFVIADTSVTPDRSSSDIVIRGLNASVRPVASEAPPPLGTVTFDGDHVTTIERTLYFSADTGEAQSATRFFEALARLLPADSAVPVKARYEHPPQHGPFYLQLFRVGYPDHAVSLLLNAAPLGTAKPTIVVGEAIGQVWQ